MRARRRSAPPSATWATLALALAAPPLSARATPAPRAAATSTSAARDALRDAEARAAAALAARDPRALADLYTLTNLGRVLDFEGRVPAALERLATIARPEPLAAAHLELLRLRERATRGDATGARARLHALGALTEARVIGPFDNAAGAGHDEPTPVEQLGPSAPALRDPGVPGKGPLVRWRAIGDALHDGALHPSRVLPSPRESTAYVFGVIEADAPTRIALRVGGTDALRVWVGGRLVHAERATRRAEPDQVAITLELSKGETPVVFKQSWHAGGARLFARVSALDGAPHRGARFVADRARVDAALARAPRGDPRLDPKLVDPPRGPRAVGVTDALDAAIDRAAPRAAQASPEARRALAEVYVLRSTLRAVLALADAKRRPQPAIVDLERAIALEPDAALPYVYLAVRIEHVDPQAATRALETAIRLDPRLGLAHAKLASLALASERTWAARDHLEAALRADPGLALAELTLIAELARSPYSLAEARARLDALTARTRSPALRALRAKVLADLGLRRQALAEAEAVLAIDPRVGGAEELVYAAALEREDTQRALAIVEARVRRDPSALGVRLVRARLVADASGLEAARARLAADAETFGDRPELLALAARLAERAGDVPAAIAALERASRLDPQRRDYGRQLAHLRGERGELEDVYGIDAAPLLEVPVTEAERRAGAIVLFERTVARLYENGHSAKLVETVVRLHRRELADAVRTDVVRFAPTRESVEILRAERLSPDGRVERATGISEDGPGGKVMGMYVDARWKQIEFAAVEPGDLVHVRYRIDGRGPNLFGGFFGELVPVEGQLPKRHVEFIALAPDERPLYPARVTVPAPTVSIDGGVQRIRWVITDVPALAAEPSAPAYTERATMLGVSTYASWEDLGRWYANLFRDQLELDDAARKAVAEVLTGARDEAEKIRRLYDYVIKNTRYVGIELGIHGWKPFPAAEVHRRRYGDCKDKATLLAAMLRHAGIEATVALVRTVDRGPFPASHATMWAFNHAITYVPGHDLYLDGTAEYSGTTELPAPDQGAFVLVVWPDGRVKLDQPPEATAAENMNRSRYVAAIEPDGTLALEGEERFYGVHAASIRQEYQEPRTQRRLLEGTLSMVAPGAEITSLDVSDLTRLEEGPSYRYGARLPRYATPLAAPGSGAEPRAPARLVVPLTLFPHRVTASYGTLERRETDLVLPYAWSTRNVIRYVVPPGYRAEELPPGQTLDTPYASLDQTIRAVDGGYEVDDTVTIKQRRVPKADYPRFREALFAIDRALERKVVLSR